jgi:hypothetical protein
LSTDGNYIKANKENIINNALIFLNTVLGTGFIVLSRAIYCQTYIFMLPNLVNSIRHTPDYIVTKEDIKFEKQKRKTEKKFYDLLDELIDRFGVLKIEITYNKQDGLDKFIVHDVTKEPNF